MKSSQTATQRRKADPATPAPAPAEREGEALVSPRLIATATFSTANEVNPRLLKAIKSAARSSDDEVRAAASALMGQMKKKHSQVRYLAILIIDELFMRSKLFRSLMVSNFDHLLSLSVGFRRNMPLPPPIDVASKLRAASIELLEKWSDSFGVHYRHIRLGLHYLKDTLGYQFPNRLENESRLQKERREREIRTKQIVLQKYEALRESYDSIKAEIQSTIDEIEECLYVLQAEAEAANIHFSSDDFEIEEFRSIELRQIRLESLKESEKVHKSNENEPLFDALRELYRLLTSKHLPSVQGWITILVRVDLSDNRFRDTALKGFIDIRNIINKVKERCDQLGCSFDDHPVPEDEDDLWEEGKIEDETTITAPSDPGYSGEPAPARDSEQSKVSESNSIKPSSIVHGSCSEPERSKLLAVAPVVAWAPILDTWGSNCDALANHRGLDLDGHWGRVDYDAVIPPEKLAALNVHRAVYKENPVEIQPCRAPLRKGGLCPRRDLRVCPFHGPIIQRDNEGKPMQQKAISDSPEEKSPASVVKREGNSAEMETCPDTEAPMVEQPAMKASKNICGGDKEILEVAVCTGVLEQLARQALKNIRKEDSGKALEREKRARGRKDDEDMLREAVLVSASALFGEHSVAPGDGDGKLKKTSHAHYEECPTAEQLARQALKNIRMEDRGKALEREKRARVRKDDEDVLREAALASASSLFGEHSGSPDDGKGKLKKTSHALYEECATAEQLARQALKNIRKEDRGKALEREKRARVHKHNEDMLREVALASAAYPQDFGEHSGGSGETGLLSRTRSRKPTLASMLRKKVTAKTRIAAKLLSSRATDTTIRQLSLEQDLLYREAFPNQW